MITIRTIKDGSINTTSTILEQLCKCKKNYYIINNKIIKGSEVLECANTSNDISNTISIDGKPKILCLHGGGMTGPSLEYLMKDYITELSSIYEFYFPNANDNGEGVWVQDPPLGKDIPTTESDWAKSSVDKLDAYIETYGPFEGILGYSQGAMFATYYLTQVPLGTFDFAVLFCGYKPETHLGLLETINESKINNTFSLNTLVYSGEFDYIISKSLTNELALLFNNLTRIHSPTMGHSLPLLYSSEYNNIILFMLAQYNKL